MASTLPAARREAAAAAMTARDITAVILDDEEFLALTRPLVNPATRSQPSRARPSR